MKKFILIALLSVGAFAQDRSLLTAKNELFEQLAILPPGHSKDEARKSLASFLNFIYQEGLRQTGQPFISSGAFMVEDSDQRLFGTLKKLVRFIADKGVADNWMCQEQTNASTDAYPRRSSHLNEWITIVSGSGTKANVLPCPYTHYGVDFQKGELSQAGKNHLLFGKYEVDGKNMVFIKLEGAGLKGSSFFSHAWGYVKSLLGIGEEQGGIYRKERIPKDILKNFTAAISAEQLKQYKERVNAFGISEIVKNAQKITNDKPNDKLTALIDELKKRYPDYCIRMGDEVIITEQKVVCP